MLRVGGSRGRGTGGGGGGVTERYAKLADDCSPVCTFCSRERERALKWLIRLSILCAAFPWAGPGTQVLMNGPRTQQL